MNPMSSGRGARAVLSDDRLTICKVCRRGVYPSQEWCWSAKPLGIVHTRCTKEEKP